MWQVYAAQAAIQIGSGLFGGKKADKAAKKAAKAQINAVTLQREEEARRAELDRSMSMAFARGAAYSSGTQVVPGGSTQQYLSFLASEGGRQREYDKAATQAEIQAIQQGAQGAGDSYRLQGLFDAASTAFGYGMARSTYKPSGPTPPGKGGKGGTGSFSARNIGAPST
jgi:hypothetical protein